MSRIGGRPSVAAPCVIGPLLLSGSPDRRLPSTPVPLRETEVLRISIGPVSSWKAGA